MRALLPFCIGTANIAMFLLPICKTHQNKSLFSLVVSFAQPLDIASAAVSRELVSQRHLLWSFIYRKPSLFSFKLECLHCTNLSPGKCW